MAARDEADDRSSLGTDLILRSANGASRRTLQPARTVHDNWRILRGPTEAGRLRMRFEVSLFASTARHPPRRPRTCSRLAARARPRKRRAPWPPTSARPPRARSESIFRKAPEAPPRSRLMRTYWMTCFALISKASRALQPRCPRSCHESLIPSPLEDVFRLAKSPSLRAKRSNPGVVGPFGPWIATSLRSSR
jgi:hypothetical protein